jgi:hypothetical protein
MKKVLLIYVILIAAIGVWWLIAEKEWSHDSDKPTKEKALAVSKHSSGFNGSIEKVIDAYFGTTEGFVKEDTISINQNANHLKSVLDGLNLDELKKDTAGIYDNAVFMKENTKGSLEQMISDGDLATKRKSFNQVSDNLLHFISSVHYDTGELYWMECATAFSDGSGFWLSDKEKSENPYGQKDCGTVKKTMNVPKK